MARRRDPRPVRMIEAAGAQLRIRVHGSRGPTIVLAPDPPNVLEHLQVVANALAVAHRVVCVELPGFGFSTPPPGFDFSVASMARVIAALLDQLGLAPYALALPCGAGLVSAAVAVGRAELVSHVIGVQAPGLGGLQRWVRRIDRRTLLRRDGLGQLIVLASRRRIARAWFDAALGDATRRAEFVAGVDAAYAAGATYPLASALQAVAREVPATVPRQPALMVWGGRDRTHRAPVRDELVPGARIVVLDGAGHFPELEDVSGFAAAVTAFLDA